VRRYRIPGNGKPWDLRDRRLWSAQASIPDVERWRMRRPLLLSKRTPEPPPCSAQLLPDEGAGVGSNPQLVEEDLVPHLGVSEHLGPAQNLHVEADVWEPLKITQTVGHDGELLLAVEPV
jgi:hypothetical protein